MAASAAPAASATATAVTATTSSRRCPGRVFRLVGAPARSPWAEVRFMRCSFSDDFRLRVQPWPLEKLLTRVLELSPRTRSEVRALGPGPGVGTRTRSVANAPAGCVGKREQVPVFGADRPCRYLDRRG